MKRAFRTFAIMALLVPALRASAETETKFFSVASGHSVTIDFDFAPSSYNQISGRDAVSVTMTKGATFAVATAVGAKGTSQVEFKSPSGGATLVTIEILDRVDEVLPMFESRIKPLGLRCSKMGDKIVATGTIHNPSDWARYERICGLSAFKGLIDDDVEFAVDASTIDGLRDDLVAAGIRLAAKGEQPSDGQVSMTYSGNVLNFSGTVYAASDVDKIVRVLKGKPWLKIVGEPKDAAKSTIAQAVVAVTVDDSLLELGVAFLKVSKSAGHKIERSKEGLNVGFLWNGFYDFLTGRHKSAENFRIDADLNSAINMLADNGVIRERQQGTIRFHANGDAGKTLHLGGSMKVTPPASGEGEAPQPQDYDYGFKIVNKNSRRISADAAEVDVDFELFGYPDFRSVAGTTIVDQKKDSYSPTVRCALGSTVAVAGFERLSEGTTVPSGAPVLRHVPVLNWFVAKQEERNEDDAICVLVSIRKVRDDEEPMVPNSELRDISYDANRSNKERIEEERERNAKYHGFWSWLNWFVW
ncbi:MAG: hypothetical protein IJ678_09645 [Kiritimatiellae bacterium]|nr:hypothetical protein [Kiritimatiellia bacterium]MBR1609862.1 hypothetical protein [Kiritimatiellia bacterium]